MVLKSRNPGSLFSRFPGQIKDIILMNYPIRFYIGCSLKYPAMKKKPFSLITIVLICFCLPFSVFSLPQVGKYANAGLKDGEVEEFFKSLQHAIDKRDKQ